MQILKYRALVLINFYFYITFFIKTYNIQITTNLIKTKLTINQINKNIINNIYQQNQKNQPSGSPVCSHIFSFLVTEFFIIHLMQQHCLASDFSHNNRIFYLTKSMQRTLFTYIISQGFLFRGANDFFLELGPRNIDSFLKKPNLLRPVGQASCYELLITLSRPVASNKRTLFYWLAITAASTGV